MLISLSGTRSSNGTFIAIARRFIICYEASTSATQQDPVTVDTAAEEIY